MDMKKFYIVLPLFLAAGAFLWLGLLLDRPLFALNCSVPGDFATIQTAVTNPACDVIEVAVGTYTENVVIARSVTINGADWTGTVVDGGGAGSVFTIQPGTAVTLTRMSITNGSAATGGGIAIDSAAANLQWLRIYSSTATQLGGGLYITGTTNLVFLTDSQIMSNTAQSRGGGIYNNANTSAGRIKVNNNQAVPASFAPAEGGGIVNEGQILLAASAVNNNSARTAAGGIQNAGILNVVSSSVHHNGVSGAFGSSGGISNLTGGTLDIRQSAIYSNTALTSAGGINNNGVLQLFNSTISGNSSNGSGGLVNSGDANINNSTIAYNQGFLSDQGGLIVSGGTVTVTNSLIVNNTMSGDKDCTVSGSLVSDGYNMDSDNSCGLAAAGDLPGTNPLLGPLQDNGGLTWTHALPAGSPAVDAANSVTCRPIDQRGYLRVGICDMGAFERVFPVWLPVVMR